jgi:AcrR family transcriptional regulator
VTEETIAGGGKPLRSQPTRDRILEAARAIFGRDGYDRATIRAIAAEADIHPAMVMRYYGNKESLFAAVTSAPVDPADFQNVPKSRLGESVIRHVLEAWDDPERSATQRAILLAALSDEDARTRYLQQHQQSYAALLERLGDSRQSIEAAALMSTQIIGLLVARYILRVPRLVSMSSEQLVREVGETLQGYVRIASG